MQATALTLSLVGLDAQPVRVEVDSGRGPASFHLVGLAEASVREARVRVRAALQQIAVDLDEFVITVNLAPADLKKGGGAFDVSIACACLAALGKLPPGALEGVALVGELSLSGEIRPIRGVLPMLRGAAALGIRRAIVPAANAAEAAAIPGLETYVVGHLADLVDHLARGAPLARAQGGEALAPAMHPGSVDLADVRGQHAAKRALEIAAAGGHNLLMVGPPGSGKTMLARRLPTLLPSLDEEEAALVTAIHSIAGLLPASAGLTRARPFRAPHHTLSAVALIGGGDPIRPGEVSLAHGGCLFLDELCEFKRPVLEALRQPLEDGVAVISRARMRATFPARPMLVAASNPCPCGHFGDPRCRCSSEKVAAYRGRLSGPLLDRIDLHVALPPVAATDLASRPTGESSADVRARVDRARATQADRARREGLGGKTNGELGPRELMRVALPDEAGLHLLGRAVAALGLSARAYDKILRVARTLADLAGKAAVGKEHIAEAVQLRLLDRSAVTASSDAPEMAVGARR